jgi:diazepam-binding inhibitor (GABA receptor modulating acyl-CoA-binding protein)
VQPVRAVVNAAADTNPLLLEQSAIEPVLTTQARVTTTRFDMGNILSNRVRYTLILAVVVGYINQDYVVKVARLAVAWWKKRGGKEKLESSRTESGKKPGRLSPKKMPKVEKSSSPPRAPSSDNAKLEDTWSKVSTPRNAVSPKEKATTQLDKGVEAQFTAAVEYMKKADVDASTNDKLDLYGLFKQACVGPCNIPEPSYFEGFEKQYKWAAWNSRKTLTTVSAMKLYVDKVASIAPGWKDGASNDATASTASSVTKSKTGGSLMSKSVSTLNSGPAPSSEEPVCDGNLYQLANSGKLELLQAALDNDATFGVDDVDEEDSQMTLLMWAIDGNRLEVVRYLVEEKKCDLTLQDIDGQSAMHFALPYKRLAYYLAEQGAPLDLKDTDGNTPMELLEGGQYETERDKLLDIQLKSKA